MLGASWMLLNAHQYFSNSLPYQLQKKTVTVRGVIVSIPSVSNNKQSFLFKVKQASYNGEPLALGTIKLNWYRSKFLLKAGQYWELQARLKRPHAMLNPFGFDYEKWAIQQGLSATGYVYNKGTNKLVHNQGISLPVLRQYLYERIKVLLTEKKELGMVLALALGEREEIQKQQWDIFRKTGTSHLVAISGLHIGLIAGFSFFITRYLWRRSTRLIEMVPAPVAAAWFSLLVAVLYAALAGFSVPTLRACVMYGIFIFAYVSNRRVKTIDVLLVALMAVLIINPMSVLSASFWLSFAAVFVIVFVVSGQFRLRKIKLYVKIQYAIFMFLFPILIVAFSQASYVAPFVNLFVIPLVSFVLLPATLIAVVITAFSYELGALIFDMLHPAYSLFWNICELFSGLSFASKHFVYPDVNTTLLALAGIFVLVFPRYIPLRWLGVLACIPIIFSDAKERNNPGEFELVFLDVGQGTAVVVKTQNHLLLYDTGARYGTGFDVGESIIIPYLKGLGRESIDKLVISHGDNDHIGGARSVINNLHIKQIESSVPKKIDGRAGYCKEGKSWIWDSVKFSYLSPAEFQYRVSAADGHQQNNASCVLMIETSSFRALLTGDIETATEYRMIRQYRQKLRANLLLAPHHGSNTSSNAEFLKFVNPEYVVFTTGYLNRYRLPSKKVVQRYRQNTAAQLFNTAFTGAIRFHIKPRQQLHKQEVDIKLYRHQSQRFWRHSVQIGSMLK